MESSRRSESVDDVKPSAAGLPSAFDFNPFAPPDYAAYGQPPPHLAGGGGDADMADDYASGTGAFHLGPHGHEPPDAGDEGDCKRPRLRLARACDRCKRRKIKCDTNSPCQPCILAKQPCTFNTPTRRTSKPRLPTAASFGGSSAEGGSASSHPAHTNAVLKARKNVKDLEARMASLEEQLRRSTEVPPHVHNQALSQLDASLLNPSMGPSGAASTAASLTPTAGSVGLPSTSASSSGSTTTMATMLHVPSAVTTTSYPTYGMDSSTSAALPTLPVESTLPPPFLPPAVPTAASSAGWGQFDFSLRPDAPMAAAAVAPPLTARTSSAGRLPTSAGSSSSRGAHKGDSLEKQMEGMNLSPGFIYLDEMGMTKWQGATSGFPLLELLASAERHPPTPPAERKPAHSPLGGTLSPAHGSDGEHTGGRSTTTGHEGEERGRSRSRAGGVSDLANDGGGGGASSASPAAAADGYGVTSSPAVPSGPSRSLSHSSPLAADGNTTAGATTTTTGTNGSGGVSGQTPADDSFFPGRKSREVKSLNPEASWKVITGVIEPDLMDTLIRSYLSTTHLLWPFLHVPSFLADYANPKRWGEPGFARFIVAVCTLSSRHVDDPRVRAVPGDPSSAGKSYLELFKKMQDLPSADRPTLYSMQANFLAAIYCMGLGTLSKAFQLFAEAITMSIDGGLHRDVGEYDIFDPIEREVRKRTFWSIYCWDKQSGACFGRPAMIHLRDCDVPEPVILDDEYITKDGLGHQPDSGKSRICAFVAAIRLHIVLEGVLDGCVRPSDFALSPFLSKAAKVIAKRHPQSEALREEEALLEDWQGLLEPHWAYSEVTVGSKDPIRITQAERLHCLENLVKMLIYRHRFSGFVLSPAETPEERARHLDLCRTAGGCALAIVADHLHISQRGFMTYYGVHVVHQLAQAGRTLLAVILNCKSPESRQLAASSIEGFRSCVGLLRRFSGRYLCGLRSADILEEFCRICHVPVDLPRVPDAAKPSPAWLRPVRRRHSRSPTREPMREPASASPASTTDLAVGGLSSSSPAQPPAGRSPAPPEPAASSSAMFDDGDFLATQASFGDLNQDPDDFVFSTEFFDLAAAASPPSPFASGSGGGNPSLAGATLGGGGRGLSSSLASAQPIPNVNGFGSFGEAMDFGSAAAGGLGDLGGSSNGLAGSVDALRDLGLPSAGMDGLMPTVEGTENLSASEILALLHEGDFDYSALFPDQTRADS